MTKVSVYVMLRIVYYVFKPSFAVVTLSVTDILLWAGIVAIFGGAVMALAQTDFKRMFCYIVVAEIGYMVGGIGLSNPVALQGVVLHILNDAVMTLGLFTVAGIITYRFGHHAYGDFKSLFKTMPVTMGAFVVVALSIIGVPPTCGFFSKWYLIQGAITAGHWVFVAALLFSSLVNVILFFKIFEIGYVFQDHAHGHHEAPVVIQEAPVSMLIPTVVTAIGIILIGLFNQSIMVNVIQFAVPGL
jgi:multicomponent Na+:H+ antiporter subunit D